MGKYGRHAQVAGPGGVHGSPVCTLALPDFAGGILGLLWVLAVSALMLAGLAGRGTDSPRRLDRDA